MKSRVDAIEDVGEQVWFVEFLSASDQNVLYG
jgi:hypothetical protein